MANITRYLSARSNGDGKKEIYLRVNCGRDARFRLRTGLFIDPARFNDGTRGKGAPGSIIYPRANQVEAEELRRLESALVTREQFLLGLCVSVPRDELTKERLETELDKFLRRKPAKPKAKKAAPGPKGFFEVIDEYLERRRLSEQRTMLYKSLKRHLWHFEAYKAKATGRAYKLRLDTFDADVLTDFEAFLRNEPAISEKYPDIYEERLDGAKHRTKPAVKGDNTIVAIFRRLRAFFNWCNVQGLMEGKPFARYSGVKTEHYGTPYYISSAERDAIAAFDLSGRPALAVQRDIFVFQCLIGCRVSDLLRLTPANIINGAVEYIPEKTRGERPEVVRVPLHPRALALVKKYAFEVEGGRLMPFISAQKYNAAIKEIFTLCGVTRMVTVLNPTTGREEQRPLNEIASSHIARRTFIGNLYKQVKDPNLVGKLSGHKEGSRAFVRYRDIDEEMKRDLIDLL